MKLIKSLMVEHRLALVSACIAGFIIIAPIMIAPVWIGEKYQGIQFAPMDDEDIYRVRIHEVLDGYPRVASPFFYEYKDFPIVVPPLNEWLFALPAFLIGLSGAIVLLKFLLTASLFFLSYLFVYRLVGDDTNPYERKPVLIASLATAFVVTLGVDFVNYVYLWDLVHGGAVQPIMWSRLVNPLVGGVQLFGFLILLEAIIARRSTYAYVYAGVLLASTVGYFFTLGTSLAILGSVLLIVMCRKEWVLVRNLMYVTGIGFVLSIWYWINIFLSITGTEGALLATRNGMSFTHAPILNKALLAGTVFVVLSTLVAYGTQRMFVYPKRPWIFVSAMLLGSWITYNQQIITGREIWYGHFSQYSVPLVFVSISVVAFYTWRTIYPRIWYWTSVVVIMGTLAYGLFSALHFIPRGTEFIKMQEYAPVFSWLNEHAEKDCVVYVRNEGDQELEKLIPAYTSCNVYSTSYNFLGVDSKRIEHNFYTDLRFSGVKNDTLDEYLRTHETDVRGVYYTNWKELFDSGETDWFLKTIKNIERKYPSILEKNTQDMLLTYKINYIVSKGDLPGWTTAELPMFVHKTSIGQYSVYSR